MRVLAAAGSTIRAAHDLEGGLCGILRGNQFTNTSYRTAGRYA